MGREIANIFSSYPRDLRNSGLYFDTLKRTKFVRSWRQRDRAAKGDVIVTTAGMLEGGPVMHYLSKIRKDENSAQPSVHYRNQVRRKGKQDIGLPANSSPQIFHLVRHQEKTEYQNAFSDLTAASRGMCSRS